MEDRTEPQVDLPRHTLFGKNLKIHFSAYKGMLYCTIWRDDTRVLHKHFSTDFIALFIAELIKLRDAPAETVRSLTSSAWDAEAKQFKRSVIVKLSKTDGLVYVLEMIDESNNSYCMPILGSLGVGAGAEPFSEKARSEIGLAALSYYFNHVLPVCLALSGAPKREWKPGQNGGKFVTPSPDSVLPLAF